MSQDDNGPEKNSGDLVFSSPVGLTFEHNVRCHGVEIGGSWRIVCNYLRDFGGDVKWRKVYTKLVDLTKEGLQAITIDTTS